MLSSLPPENVCGGCLFQRSSETWPCYATLLKLTLGMGEPRRSSALWMAALPRMQSVARVSF